MRGVGGTISNPKITTPVKDVVKSAVEKKVDQKKEDLKKEAEKKILDLLKPKK